MTIDVCHVTIVAVIFLFCMAFLAYGTSRAYHMTVGDLYAMFRRGRARAKRVIRRRRRFVPQAAGTAGATVRTGPVIPLPRQAAGLDSGVEPRGVPARTSAPTSEAPGPPVDTSARAT